MQNNQNITQEHKNCSRERFDNYPTYQPSLVVCIDPYPEENASQSQNLNIVHKKV